MSLSQQDLAALAGLIDSKIAAAITPDEPKAATATAKDKTTTTARKAAAVSRKLDLLLVTPGSSPTKFVPGSTELPDGAAFVVTPCYGQGGVRTSGAAVLPYIAGRKRSSLTGEHIVALGGDGVLDSLMNALDTVNRAAKIGEHSPAAA